MQVRYTKADWEGVQDDVETAFHNLRQEATNRDLMMVRTAARNCRLAVERCVAVGQALGHSYNGIADLEAIRMITFHAA